MINTVIIICLFGYLIVQQVSIHKLVNKLMAKSYYDYEVSKSLGTLKQNEQSPMTEIKMGDELPDGMGRLSGF